MIEPVTIQFANESFGNSFAPTSRLDHVRSVGITSLRPWNYARVDKVCCQCGKSYTVSPRDSKSKCCSRGCSYKNQFREFGLTANCEVCSKAFRTTRWKLNHGKGRFCSPACFNNVRKNEIIVACDFCSKLVARKISQHKRHKFHFCGDPCQKSFLVGENHPHFIGGTNYGYEWRIIRKEVRDRDRVCQRCGKTSIANKRALDVHHIIPFETFGYQRRLEAHTKTNLITLCRSCHKYTEEHIANT